MESIMKRNALADPAYCPYCLRCPGLVRMIKVCEFGWRCRCGAQHDERDDQSTELPDLPFVGELELFLFGRIIPNDGRGWR